MKKPWMKRWMAAGLSAVLLAGLSGCGSAQNEQNASKETSARIGFITAYTGPGSAYGQAMKDGVDLAVREINSNPGTRVKIDLVTYDTKLNKTEAISAMKKAIEQDKVLAVEGPMTSGEMMAAGPVAQQLKTVAFGTGPTAPGITDIGDYIFRNAVPGELSTPIVIRKAESALHFKTAAVLYSSNNDQAVSENQIYQSLLREMGVQIVDTETFADKDTDFSAQLTSIQSKNPDVLIIAGLYQEGALIMKKAREMGMNQPVIGSNGFNSPAYLKLAGSSAEGTIVATPWNPDKKTEKAQHFRQAFFEAYNHEPDQFAAQSYDAMYLIHEAVEKSGSVTDRKKFRDTLAGIKDFEGATGQFAFDEKRNPQMDLDILTVRGGKWVPMTAE